MNPWFEATKRASEDADAAEQSERRGHFAEARRLFHGAADSFAAVSLCVPADHPNTRGDLAIAAVACYARAGELDRTTEHATRALVEDDALTTYGKDELRRLLESYSALRGPARTVTRGEIVRNEVRARFRLRGGAGASRETDDWTCTAQGEACS